MRKKTMLVAGAVLTAVFASSTGISAAEMPAGSLEKLVGLYMPIQEALAGDSVAVIAGQAAKLAAEADSIAKASGGKPTLDAIEDLEAVVVAAKGMKATEIKGLREQFKALSHAVGRLVERQAVAGHAIYYCPMADAYWVQKSGAVKNPYYGSQMLGCGEAVAKVAD